MKFKTLLLAVLIVCTAILHPSQAALAHETITVGDYEIEVGWLKEPPLAGQLNAITLEVVNTASGEAQPVEDISLLTVQLSYGGQEKTLEFKPLGEDAPGQFAASILPTIPGEYQVVFGGTLGGNTVDVETHVEEVEPADTLAFPSADQAGASDTGSNWLVWLSLLIGLIGIALGTVALRRASAR